MRHDMHVINNCSFIFLRSILLRFLGFVYNADAFMEFIFLRYVRVRMLHIRMNFQIVCDYF